MKKYEVRICRCGCVHFIPWKYFEDAVEQNKEFVTICNRCGEAVRYGADDYFDEGNALYCYPLDTGEITKSGLIRNLQKFFTVRVFVFL